jgi:hypothetical protein
MPVMNSLFKMPDKSCLVNPKMPGYAS